MRKRAVAIHQPNYIPWLGYFYKIYKADVFVFHDDARYSESGMHNYHYIKTPQGHFRLKIPVSKPSGARINQVSTKDHLNWKDKHLKIIAFNYKKARYFTEVFNDFSELLLSDYPNLAEMNQSIIMALCNKLSIDAKFVLSSDLNLQSEREEKILDTCDAVKAKVYYSGRGAQAYQNETNFTKRGVQLEYSDYSPFEYFQLWGAFEPNVSIIDYLMYNGYDWDKVLAHQAENG